MTSVCSLNRPTSRLEFITQIERQFILPVNMMKAILRVIQRAQEVHLHLSPADLPREWVCNVVSTVKERCTVEKFHGLSGLCNALFLDSTSDEELSRVFDACPFKESLCSLLAKASKGSAEDADSVKAIVLLEPRKLADLLCGLSADELSQQGYSQEDRDIYSALIHWSYVALQTLDSTIGNDAYISSETLAKAISVAACNQMPQVVSFLLSASLTNRNSNFLYALDYLVKFNRLEGVETLLKQIDEIPVTVLTEWVVYAIRRGYFDLARALRSNGREISLDQREALVGIMASSGLDKVMEWILSKSEAISPYDLGWAVRRAAKSGHLNVVKGLLRQGRTISDFALAASVCWAAKAGHLHVVRYLLCEVKAVAAGDLQRAFLWAAKAGHLEVVLELERILGHVSGNILHKAFLSAAERGYHNIVAHLLGGKRHFSSYFLDEAISRVCANGDLEMLKLLVKDRVMKQGSLFVSGLESYVYISAAKGHLDVLNFLLKGEREVSVETLDAAVLKAATLGYIDVLKFLLTDPRSIPFDSFKRTLSLLTQSEHSEVIEFLFSKMELREDLLKNQQGLIQIFQSLIHEDYPNLTCGLLQFYCDLIYYYPDFIKTILDNAGTICKGNTSIYHRYMFLSISFLYFKQDIAALDSLLEQISFHKDILRSSESYLPLSNFLILLIKSFNKSGQEIILNLFGRSGFNPKKTRQYLQSMIAYMTALISLDSYNWIEGFLKLPYESKKDSLLDHLVDRFSSLGSLSFSKDQFEDVYKEMRNPNALFLYLKTVTDYTMLRPIYSECLQHVMNGTFEKWRCEDLTSSHIQKMKDDHRAIWDKWLSPIVKDVSLVVASSAPSTVDILGYIKAGFAQGHDKMEDGSVHPYLEGFAELLEKPKDELYRLFRELEMARASGAPENNKIITQRALLKMILSKDSAVIRERLAEVLTTLREGGGCQLCHDLDGFNASFRSLVPKATESFVTHTQRFEDLFLSGTEVIGSCQSVTAGSDSNRCLMAYVVDAKNSMIAVKSASKVIESRAILRLLFEGENPVLFLDRLYSKYPTVPAEHDRVIKEHAHRVAESLGVPLYVYDVGGSVSLVSLGSVAFYEYADAGGGVTNGFFTASKASLYARP